MHVLFYNYRHHNQAKLLRTWGEQWGMPNSNDVVVFIDNHDNQRGHGGGGNTKNYSFIWPRNQFHLDEVKFRDLKNKKWKIGLNLFFLSWICKLINYEYKYQHIAIKWLKYCRYGVKRQSINQSIFYRRSSDFLWTTIIQNGDGIYVGASVRIHSRHEQLQLEQELPGRGGSQQLAGTTPQRRHEHQKSLHPVWQFMWEWLGRFVGVGFSPPLKNFSLIWRRHQYWWRAG